jgi:hypothetical protein
MDMPSFEGLTIWGMLGVVVWMIGTIALKFFSTASVKIRLIVFFSIFILLGSLAIVVIKNQELTNAPVPPAVSQPSSGTSGFIRNAYAQSNEQWIYCGEYDAATQHWSSNHLNLGGETPTTLEGKTFSPTHSVRVYDRPPSFSFLALRWELGSLVGSIPQGENITIQQTQTLGRNRVWCLITKS